MDTSRATELAAKAANQIEAMIAYWDADQRCQYANPAYQAWFGQSAEQLYGMTLFELLGPAYQHQVHYVQGALRGERQVFERRIPAPSGLGYRDCLATYSPDFEDGVVRGFWVHDADISPLRESQERYETLRQSALEAIITINLSGKIVEWNNGATQSFGYSPEDAIGQPLSIIVPLRFLGNHEASFGKLSQGETPRVMRVMRELAGKRRDGSEFPIEISLSECITASGRYFTAIVRDISARKQAEAVLWASIVRYRDLFQQSPDGIIHLSAEGKTLAVNEAYARMHGYTVQEMMQLPLIELEVGTDLEKKENTFLERAHRVMSGETLRFEVVQRHRDGSALPLEVTASLVSVGGESILQGTVRDITERRRAIALLAQGEAFKQSVLDSMNSQIAVLDSEGGIIAVNKRWWNNLAEDDPNRTLQGVGCNYLEVCRRAQGPDAELAMRVHDAILEILAKRSSYFQAEYPCATHPGERWFHLALSPLDDDHKGVVVSHEDITDRHFSEQERQRFERNLAETQKLESLGIMAGGVAHDFNNMLGGMLGATENALRQLQDSKYTECTDRLKDLALHIQSSSDLCRQLLAYAGRGRFEVANQDVHGILADMVWMAETTISKKAVLVKQLASDLPMVMADSAQLGQVMLNLIINAAESLPDDGGTVTVRTGCEQLVKADTQTIGSSLPPGDYVLVEVADTGCGMSEAIKAQIFEPFYTTKRTGRGLGLSAVLGIVRGHKGGLRVRSILGLGSCFTVLLPVSRDRAASVEAEAKAVGPASHGRILVVEDDEWLRENIVSDLEAEGFQVVTTCNGAEGLKAVQDNPDGFQLVLMDLTMPVMGGVEAFPLMRAAAPALKVVLMSGYDEFEVSESFTNGKPTGFLRKPFTAAQRQQQFDRALAAP